MKHSKRRQAVNNLVTNSESENRCQVLGCTKQYSSKNGLERHVQSAHLGKKFSCQICGKLFNYDYHAQRHLKNVHYKTLKKTI